MTTLKIDEQDTHLQLKLEGDEPLEVLRGLQKAAGAIDLWRDQFVESARRAGEPWEAIGNALGITRQAAWKLYRERTRHELDIGRRPVMSDEDAMRLAVEEVRDVRRERSRRDRTPR